MNFLPIVANTATDAMKKSIDYVRTYGVERIRWGGTIPKTLGVGGPQNFDRLMLEVPFFCLELLNPRARWTNIGNQAFITLAEMEDHLLTRNPGILPRYSKLYTEWLRSDGTLPYSYGERIRNWEGHDQLVWARDHLITHPNSRKCIISINNPERDHTFQNPPCNIAFQVEIINNRLNWTTINRSQDIINGLSENIFMFTIWQEELLRMINNSGNNVDMGIYRVLSSNAHMYQKHMDVDYSRSIEPYHDWDRDFTFKLPIPGIQFDYINEDLFAGKFKLYNILNTIEDEFWRAWKAALVAEWAIKRSDEELALGALRLAAEAPWSVPVARNYIKQFGHLENDIVPSRFIGEG